MRHLKIFFFKNLNIKSQVYNKDFLIQSYMLKWHYFIKGCTKGQDIYDYNF